MPCASDGSETRDPEGFLKRKLSPSPATPTRFCCLEPSDWSRGRRGEDILPESLPLSPQSPWTA